MKTDFPNELVKSLICDTRVDIWWKRARDDEEKYMNMYMMNKDKRLNDERSLINAK